MGRFDDLTRLDEIKEKPTSPRSPFPSHLPANSQKVTPASPPHRPQRSPQQSQSQTIPESSTSDGAQSTKRTFIKRTFDLFEDQLNYLTKESLQDRLSGKESSMNAMVREAIDDWIQKRKAKK